MDAQHGTHTGSASHGWKVRFCLTGGWGLRLQPGSHHRSHCEVTSRLGDIDYSNETAFLLGLHDFLY